MNTYKIQLKLHTLAHCVTEKDKSRDSFTFEEMCFKHWDFSWTNGHRGQAWLISNEVAAQDFRSASKIFFKKLNDVIPKIAFISQCYTEYFEEPFLIHKIESNTAFFQYRKSCQAVPLHFDNESLEALKQLTSNQNISNAFFYYWNDMINTTGYSSKLLLACFALEALAKSEINKKEKFVFLSEVLGEELKNKLFAPKERGLRHRLAHGEYFSFEMDQENYLDQIYKKVIAYFNNNILTEKLINESVVNPQRHPYGNKEGWRGWLKSVDSTQVNFDLKTLVDEWDKEGIDSLNTVEIALPSEVESAY